MAGIRFTELQGHTIAYREAGDGAPLVLLHGFLCDSRCWRSQLSRLSRHFRVVAWDAPGAGLSSDPPPTFRTADYARALVGFVDSMGIDKAHLLGLSWGGILAQEFYRQQPERINSLVLAGTYAGWKGSLPEAAWRERLATCLADAHRPPADVVAKFVPGMFTDGCPRAVREELSRIVAAFHPLGFRLMSESSAELDTRALLPEITVRTLLIWGADDRRSPLHVADQFQASIPDAELAIIPNAGHLSNMERPAAFNAHVRRFCLAA